MFRNSKETKKFEKKSYAQCGEDLIIKFIFEGLKIKKPNYLDIGANHPYHYNNTAIFYENGSRGVNIEPDPNYYSLLLRYRSNDINLQMGIAEKEGSMKFYHMSQPSLNTFSAKRAQEYEKYQGIKIIDTEEVTVNTSEYILKKYFSEKAPDLLSLDAEGYDSQIILNWKFNIYLPLVICLETITYSECGRGEKERDLIEYIKEQGYMVYGDTYINTIFVLKKYWIR